MRPPIFKAIFPRFHPVPAFAVPKSNYATLVPMRGENVQARIAVRIPGRQVPLEQFDLYRCRWLLVYRTPFIHVYPSRTKLDEPR